MEISVIVPLYNAECHIKQCIESLLNQSYKDYELVIINDGSTDNSLNIVNKLLKGRDNINIYTQENKGVSVARNVGISKATGKYITFIDSDDIVDKHYIETLHNAIDESNFDLIMSGSSYLSNGKITRKVTLADDTWSIKDLSTKFLYIDYTTSIHGKLYKKELIDKYNIKFNSKMSYAEDRDFNIEYIRHINKARNISYIGYYYNTDIAGSLSKKVYIDNLKNDCIYWGKVLKLYNDDNFNIYVANRIFHAIVDNISIMIKHFGWYKTFLIYKDSQKYINESHIKKYINNIEAPQWQKICFSIIG